MWAHPEQIVPPESGLSFDSRGFLEQRRKGAARAAPGGPEVDDYRGSARALDDLDIEIGLADIDNGHRHSL